MTLLERIKELCIEKGTNPSKLEIELGFGRATLYKWEKSSPTSDRIEKVADYFNVSVDYLLGKEPFKSESEAHFSINIAAVKHLLKNKAEIPRTFDTYSAISTLVDGDSDPEMLTYTKSLLNKFDENLPLTNLELYELSHILFKEVKGHDHTGVIITKNFYDNSLAITLNLDEVERIDSNKLGLNSSFLFKSKEISCDPIFKYESVLDNIAMQSKTIKPTTIAAHLPDGVELTGEEEKDLDDYIQFLLSRRKD